MIGEGDIVWTISYRPHIFILFPPALNLWSACREAAADFRRLGGTLPDPDSVFGSVRKIQ
jgi:hypothetical protein